ncbi:HD family phosphohydrolase, partial [bacterium]
RQIARLEDFVSIERNEKVSQAVLLVGTAFLMALLLIPSQHFQMTRYTAGDIAPTDIKATQSYLVEDRALTEQKRLEAERAAPLVYELVPDMADQVRKRFAQVFALVIDGRGSAGLDREGLRRDVSRVLGSDVALSELSALERIRNFGAALAEIGHVVDDIYGLTVVADRATFAADRRHGIILYERGSGRQLGAGEGLDRIVDLREAAGQVPQLRLGGPDRRETPALRVLLKAALQPNLVVNPMASDARRRDARSAVRPVVYQIKRGEMIVREGERISSEQAVKLNSIFEVGRGMNRFRSGAGIFSLLLVMFYFSYRFGRKNIQKFNPGAKDLLLLALITVGLFAFLKIAYGISSAMGILFPRIGIDNYFYLLPFAAGAMLVRIIL